MRDDQIRLNQHVVVPELSLLIWTDSIAYENHRISGNGKFQVKLSPTGAMNSEPHLIDGTIVRKRWGEPRTYEVNEWKVNPSELIADSADSRLLEKIWLIPGNNAQHKTIVAKASTAPYCFIPIFNEYWIFYHFFFLHIHHTIPNIAPAACPTKLIFPNNPSPTFITSIVRIWFAMGWRIDCISI